MGTLAVAVPIPLTFLKLMGYMNKYDKREKATLALMTEYNELGDLQKENSYYEQLEVPIFRGYNISLKLREDVARSERGERFQKVWHLIAPKTRLVRGSIWFKVKNLIQPLSAQQAVENGEQGGYYSVRTYFREHVYEIRPRREKGRAFHNIYVGLHGITEKEWLGLTPDLQKLFYKVLDWERHVYRYDNRIYLPKLASFELSFKVEKYFQTQILVEDAKIDSREKEIKAYLWERDDMIIHLPGYSRYVDRWGAKGSNTHKSRYLGRNEKRAKYHGYMRRAYRLAEEKLVEEELGSVFEFNRRNDRKYEFKNFDAEAFDKYLER